MCVVVSAGGGLRERNGGHTWSKTHYSMYTFFKQQRVQFFFYQTKHMVSGERAEETVWTRAFWVVFKGYLTSVYCVLIETSSRAAAVQFPFTPSSYLTREESFDKGAGPCSSRIVGLPILAMKPCPGSYHHLTLVFLYENRYNDIYSVCVTRVS